MGCWRWLLFICAMMVMIGIGSGEVIPDSVTVTNPSPQWVVAGSLDTSTFSVNIVNNSGISENLIVSVKCDPLYGSISPQEDQSIMLVAGQITLFYRFAPKTIKYEVPITIVVKNHSGFEYYNETPISISVDHSTPRHYRNIIYEPNAPVNSLTPITVRLKDNLNNIVDSKNPSRTISENITFVTSLDGPEIYDADVSKGHRYTKPIDINGDASVLLKLPTVAGQNIIQITAEETVVSPITWITIKGTALIPANISGTILPNKLLGDGKETATIIFTLKDTYRNPVPDYEFYWWTNIGEEVLLKTNSFGQVRINYGPKLAVVDVEHYAGLESDNPLWSGLIQFISPGSADFLLVAKPQTIPSLDRESLSFSTITVTLIDQFGNPVTTDPVDNIVTFDILEVFSDSSLDEFPKFSESDSNETDQITAQGKAAVTFIPGKFSENSPFASGSALIEAKWNESARQVLVEFKNYPHLRVNVTGPTDCLPPGNETEIRIKIIGDGYEMIGPVDVLLLEDRSNTMLWGATFGKYTTKEDQDRMWSAVDASNIFIGCLTNNPPGVGTHRVAIASYGDNVTPANLNNDAKQLKWVGDDNTNDVVQCFEDKTCYTGNGIDNYDFWSIHMGLKGLDESSTSVEAEEQLNRLTPYNDEVRHDDGSPENQYSAPIRKGLYESIIYLRQNGDSKSTKAIVGLMDTDWTWYGDPLAYQTGSTMKDPWREASAGTSKWYPFNGNDYQCSDYPDPCPTRIGNINTWDISNARENWQNMSIFAKENNISLWMVYYNGQYDANTFKALQTLCEASGGQAYYADTPEKLTASLIDIARKLPFMVAVNTTGVIDFSTITVRRNLTDIPYDNNTDVFEYIYRDMESTFIVKQTEKESYQETIDQWEEWEKGYLNFTIGNLSKDDWWSAKFILKAEQEGVITLFTNNSLIKYYDEYHKGERLFNDTIWSPQICIETDPTKKNPSPIVLEIIFDKENDTQYNNITDKVNITWHLQYNWTVQPEPIKQIISYQFTTDFNCADLWTNNWISFAVNHTDWDTIKSDPEYQASLDVGDMAGCVKLRIYSFEEPEGGPSDTEYSFPIPIPPKKGQIIIQ